jgi:hypothetical protein
MLRTRLSGLNVCVARARVFEGGWKISRYLDVQSSESG